MYPPPPHPERSQTLGTSVSFPTLMSITGEIHGREWWARRSFPRESWPVVLPWGCGARLYGVRCWPRRGTLAWQTCTLGVKAGQTGREPGLACSSTLGRWPGATLHPQAGEDLFWLCGRVAGEDPELGAPGCAFPGGQVSPPAEDRATCLLPHRLG